ncbi:YhzD family protein [Bacillus piscicola]|uniref:YhzD family protein n=1 Tax=Bacillus piscicola TaxID=1632684 RepID=UPI001F093C32|nr:YhzD family protein [Bacillus piscicola]
MQYYLTVFEKDGSLLLNETFAFPSDNEAISYGNKRLKELDYGGKTHRLTRNGKLLLFQR